MDRDPNISLLERPSEYDHERRTRDDTETWAAEVLNGPMRTQFEYFFDGRELYGQDGGAMGPVFRNAIEVAEKQAAFDPRLKFEVRRRYHEADELLDMYAMAAGQLPNTMVVVSDSPAELQQFENDVAGYNVRRKQAMLRIITRTPEGTLKMYSQSLDQSDRQALEDIYGSLGFTARPGELLGQRMHVDLDPADQEFLVDQLTGVYDRSMSRQYGGQWYAGRNPIDSVNTYDFVKQQSDVVSMFVSAKLQDSQAAERLRFDMAATLEKRFNGRLHITQPQVKDLLQEVQQASIEAQSLGRVFSGCGVTVDQISQTEEQLAKVGYGNQVCREIKNGQWVSCPDCKLYVKAKVPNKETVFCSNLKCKLADPKDVTAYRRGKAAYN